jgi:hypothetical protein
MELLAELSAHQRALLRMYPCPRVFAVVSWGCAATSWLATVLNRHPDIYCVHAANVTWQVLGNSERMDGVPYLRIIGSQGHAHQAAGCVHGVSRHLIPECRRSFGDKFSVAVVVREPMQRIHSQLALFRKAEGCEAWDLEYTDSVISRSGVTLESDDYRSRLFVHAANMLNAILEEREVGKIYRCEDLTRSPQVLGDFVDRITGGKVSPGPGWLESAVEVDPINVHAGNYPQERLEEWQIDVIRKVVAPRSWELYERLGYPRPEFARR